MPVQPEISVKEFLGLDNVTDASRLPVRGGKSWLTIADNVDIDDDYMVHRRKGWNSVYSANISSMWSNGMVAYFSTGDEIWRLKDDYTATIILRTAHINDYPIQFVEGGGFIFFGNTAIIGYIQNHTAYAFPTPSDTFKKKMVGGHLLEWYNTRLYAAEDNMILFSDAAAPMRMDKRKNFIQFATGRITMMQAVTDGIYVSAGEKTYFLSGKDPFEMERFEVTGSGAIEGTAIKIPSEEFAGGGTGSIVAWASNEGVFTGQPQGKVSNKTWSHYVPDDVKVGSSVVRFDNGYGQYIIAYEVEFNMSGEIDTPAFTTLGWMK